MEQVGVAPFDGAGRPEYTTDIDRNGIATETTTQGERPVVADIGREDQRMQDVGCAGDAEGGVSFVLRDGEARIGTGDLKLLSGMVFSFFFFFEALNLFTFTNTD